MAKSKSMAAAPGTAVTGQGKTGIRTTMTNTFGKRGVKRKTAARGGRR